MTSLAGKPQWRVQEKAADVTLRAHHSRQGGTVWPQQNRRLCFGIACWSAANAWVSGSSRFCGAPYSSDVRVVGEFDMLRQGSRTTSRHP